MERYDNVDYDFSEENVPNNDSVFKTTDKDGFITSQQYIERTAEPVANDDVIEEIAFKTKEKKPKDKNAQREIVVTCQLVICIIIALIAFVIKGMGGELYEKVREFYYENLNSSLIIDIDKDTNDQAIEDILNDIAVR